MTATALVEPAEDSAFVADVESWFREVGAGLREGLLAPFLGPGLAGTVSNVAIPTSYEALADFIGRSVALPKRARGNAWASAQYVESRKHRSTVTQLMRTAFAPALAPSPFHRHLSTLPLQLIVDTWYDGALRTAFEGRHDWAEIQGINRVQIGESGWFRAYGPDGGDLSLAEAGLKRTLIYKPHGSIAPVGNFLITDADYVEVLTEIDIQSPIPGSVRERRTELGFVFLGCRFNDQLLRTYARQVVKRSRGPLFAILDGPEPSRMELKFLEELNIQAVALPLAMALVRLKEASS